MLLTIMTTATFCCSSLRSLRHECVGGYQGRNWPDWPTLADHIKCKGAFQHLILKQKCGLHAFSVSFDANTTKRKIQLMPMHTILLQELSVVFDVLQEYQASLKIPFLRAGEDCYLILDMVGFFLHPRSFLLEIKLLAMKLLLVNTELNH